MNIDWFGRKASSENEILGKRFKSIKTLLQNSHLLEGGTNYLNYLVDRCNHKLPVEELLSAVSNDIRYLMAEDRQSGAYLLNSECRPLVLFVELGYESILLATARLNTLQGRDFCEIESHRLLKGGVSVLERSVTSWLCKIVAAQHPNISVFQEPSNAFPHLETLARKLLKLTVNGSADITLQEKVVIGGTPLLCSVPFSCKTISEQLMSLLGEYGSLLDLIRKFLSVTGVAFEHIDRVVCAGILGTLPLLHNTLGSATSRPVITAHSWYKAVPLTNSSKQEVKQNGASVNITIRQHPVLQQQRTKGEEAARKDDEIRMQQLLQAERDKAFRQQPELLAYSVPLVQQKSDGLIEDLKWPAC